MPLSPAYYMRRAEEARIASRLCHDAELSRLLLEIAQAYEDLAGEQRTDNAGMPRTAGRAG